MAIAWLTDSLSLHAFSTSKEFPFGKYSELA